MSENCFSKDWTEALASLGDGAELLQSDVWRAVAEAEGKKVWRLAWSQGGRFLVLAQILETTVAGFKTWYLPRGPIFLSQDAVDQQWRQVKEDLLKQAGEQGVIVIKFEPQADFFNTNICGQSIAAIQPKRSLFLDLRLSEEVLLEKMHPKTRYNIRLADKQGVKIVPGDEHDLLTFWNLLQKTAVRDRFRGHGLNHYRCLLKAGQPILELWLAKRADQVLAAGIFSFYQGRAVYWHGASDNEGRQYMAPHLLQWQMIKRARNMSCRYYDFYGIDEQRWPGVTRFKRGFGGEERVYPGAFLLIVSPYKYWFYRLAVSLRLFLRRFF